MQPVNQLFVAKIEGGETYYPLNAELVLQFGGEQEATQFLVEAIRFWRGKRGFFCNDITSKWEGEYGKDAKQVALPEEEWRFSYKTPSDHCYCVSGQEILDKIFGDRRKFNVLPFVTYNGDRQYSFTFNLLKHFAENGHDSTVRLIEEREQEAVRKKAEAEAEHKRMLCEEQSAQLAGRLGDTIISEELRRQILPYADEESLVIAAEHDVAAVLTTRSEHGSSGGIGYYSQVRVFYGSQEEMQEWQWRDRYTASNDKPWLRVYAIGAVKVSENKNGAEVEVELVNNEHSNRKATYTFNPPKPTVAKTLSVDEQATFTAQAEKEVARIMTELNWLWELKPKMASSHGYVPYRQPAIKQREFKAEIGIAAFVTEEQIDHRIDDPQVRYELYVLTTGSEHVERKAEDHGYDRGEGGAFLTILEVGPERIVINTKNGKKTIVL